MRACLPEFPWGNEPRVLVYTPHRDGCRRIQALKRDVVGQVSEPERRSLRRSHRYPPIQ